MLDKLVNFSGIGDKKLKEYGKGLRNIQSLKYFLEKQWLKLKKNGIHPFGKRNKKEEELKREQVAIERKSITDSTKRYGLPVFTNTDKIMSEIYKSIKNDLQKLE